MEKVPSRPVDMNTDSNELVMDFASTELAKTGPSGPLNVPEIVPRGRSCSSTVVRAPRLTVNVCASALVFLPGTHWRGAPTATAWTKNTYDPAGTKPST